MNNYLGKQIRLPAYHYFIGSRNNFFSNSSIQDPAWNLMSSFLRHPVFLSVTAYTSSLNWRLINE